MIKIIFVSLSIAFFVLTTTAQPDCSKISTGFIPINDIGTGTYNGWTGGLYPNGSNNIPEVHKRAGLALSSQIKPLDSGGELNSDGKIVWLSIGMSNASLETQAFIKLTDTLSNKNPHLKIVDGAVGGKTARIISSPGSAEYIQYWDKVYQRLSNAGVSPKQVQIIWYKQDNPAGSPVPNPLREHFDSLLIQSKRIMNEIKIRFPNAKLAYIASRIYAGYATTLLNPEPYAYQNGWTMKKLIEDQINGDPQLQYNGSMANSPWLSWGVYLWADGTIPRSDGLTWICPDDYQNDGTHPSPNGSQKVAKMLLQFFKTDSTTFSWFLSNNNVTTGFESTGMDFDIYPNPFSSMVSIKSDKPLKNASVIVYNGIGQEVKKLNGIWGNGITIDFSGMTGKLFFVTITSGNRNIIRKLIKE